MIKQNNYILSIDMHTPNNTGTSFRQTVTLLCVLALILVPTYNLIPTAPIIASPNTQSSPSNLIFSFQLDNDLRTSSYLMVVLPIYPSAITPLSCTLLNTAYTSTICVNLNTASNTSPNPLTINSTAVNNLNPNIQSTLTVVVGFSNVVSASTSYQLQILLSDNLPSIGALSTSFEMYAISGTGIMQQQNWNMGQVFFQLKNNHLMSIVSVNSMVSNSAGAVVSTLQINVQIGVSCPTPLSVFLFTISGDYTFTVGSQVTTIGASPPQILTSTVVSPKVIKATFNEQFVSGRQFTVAISNIQNPMEISSGAVSLYSLPYNSISPLQVKQLSIPFQTISLPAIVNIYTAQGLTPNSAVEFYLQTIQYVTISIQLPGNFNPSYILQITSDALEFQEGTVFARTNTVNFNSLIYTIVNLQTIQISGFTSTIPSGSVITVTMRVWINTNPIFNVYVSIDTIAHINANAPIIYGTASATVTATPSSYISGLTGNGNEPNKLTMQLDGTTSSIYFSVTPLFQTIAGSFLIIYTSTNLVAASSFNSASSCLINGVGQSCSITTTPQVYTMISIYSSSSSNLFAQSSTTTVQINQVRFKYASSHSYYIYHFYFQLTVSLASQASVQKYLVSPMVVLQRNQLTSFGNYFTNNIYNAGNNFMNVIRLVSPNVSEWQNTIQSYQKRIISIFTYQGWSNGLVTVSPSSSYPCLSNLAGTTFTYIRGSNLLNLTTDFPLNWDRINIVLPGTESTAKFNIIIPTQYSSSTPVYFQIMVGIIDTTNGAITYLNSEAWPLYTGCSTTCINPVNISVYSKPQRTSMQFNVMGLAGSYKSNVTFTVQPSSSFTPTTYSAGLIVKTSWQFYDSLTSLASSSLSSVYPNPQFNTLEQSPLCIQISSSSYLTYIPFMTNGVYTTIFNISLNNVKLPYNMDPYYSILLIDGTGAVDGYNEFINQNNNNFYSGILSYLAITCNDNSQGVTNTYCTITFIPFQDIEVASIINIKLVGMSVTTNLCSMIYTSLNTSVPISYCGSNANNITGIMVTLANTARLPGLTSYSLIINGVSISSSALWNYITLQVMDPTGSYIVQQKSVLLTTSVAEDFPIYITEVDFTFNNPVVSSSLILKFTLPRNLYPDESFALIMSKDFTNLNSIPCKIRIQLLQADGVTVIPTQWILKYANSLIIFQGLQSALGASSYSLQMYGINTPSTVTQDMIGIIYLRNYDNTQTKSNTVASTAVFPSLTSKVNSLITLQTYFNTEGLEQELCFTVINQYQVITQNTIWIVNFPRYYSPDIWNQAYLMYCTISGTPLTCALSYTPYEIIISGSPRIIQVGSTYTISIYGIPCPRATYLNGNNLFVTENIFFAMATSSTATSYSDYSQLFVSNTIISPQSNSYGSIILQSISSTNMQVYQTTFFTITLTCSVAIIPGYWIFITFPSSFNNFNNIPVVVQTQYSVANFQISNSSSVVNFRIGYQINSLTIAANTQFQIMITSLFTGSSTSTIDMNTMKVLVASSDRLTTYASTVQSRNQLSPLTFLPNSLYLIINNYIPIQITAGTYSNPIQISASDSNTFSTNMLITFSSTQLTFSPNPAYLYLGNSYSTFIIGATQNIIPTTYSFNLVKKQTSISAYYSTLSQYAVIVNSIPIAISFPSSFTVPIGGCSLPSQITITNPPYSNVNINFQYDTVAVPPNQFWMNQQLSYQQMIFDLNDTQRWISFCSNYTMTATSFNITMQLGGDNAASYSLSTLYTTINVVSQPSLNVTPSFTLSISNVQKTYVSVCFTTNVVGLFFYELQLAPLSNPMTIQQIKSYIKSNSLVLQSNQDFLTTKIYIGDRDQRLGYAAGLIAGSNYASIDNLLPERSYQICGYYSTLFLQATSVVCLNFTTQSWGSISKAYISFNSPLLANQLNNVLCFFVKASNSQITQIVDLQGNSCSLKTSPQNYYYTFTGNTTTQQTSSTIIYHTANVNLTSDASISAFNSLFDSNGLTTNSLTVAQTQFSINFVNSSYALTSFQPMTAIYANSSAFQPQVTFTVQPYVTGSYQLVIDTIKSNIPSSIYFILVSYKNISTNQITAITNITIKTLKIPTSDQIASCLDGSGYAAVQCMRVIIQSGITYSFNFSSIVENSVYALQYTVANEYPQRPVFYGGVHTQYIFTTNWSSFIFGLLYVLWTCLLF